MKVFLLRALVGARPLYFEEVRAPDMHHDDVGNATRRVLGKGAEGATALIENRDVIGPEEEMAPGSKIVEYR